MAAEPSNDKSSSGFSGLSAERTAAIRARHERDSARYALSALTPNELRIRAREARADRADLLAAYDQIAQEREHYRVQVEERYGAVAQWQAEAEINRQAWLKAEAALVVLTQRQEQMRELIYKWRETGAMEIDVSPTETGYNLGLRVCADGLEKALGLLGSTVPEDAPR